MTIEQLEQHIKELGSLRATALLQYEQSGCFSALGEADGYALQMEAAIEKRKQEQETQA